MEDKVTTTYHEFLTNQQSVLIEAISRDLAEQSPLYQQRAPTEIAPQVRIIVQGYIGTLATNNHSALDDVIGQHFLTFAEEGAQLTSVQQMVTIYRSQFINCSLPVLTRLADTPGGFQQLLSAFDATTAMISQFYTQQKAALAAQLRQSENRFKAFIEAVGSIVMVMDLDNRIQEWNPEAERIYGWNRDEVLGHNYLDLFIPEPIRPAILADLQKVLRGTPTRGFENPVIARDGTMHYILWNVTRLLDNSGQPIGVITNGQDITDYRRTQEQLKQNEAQFQSILDNSPLSIFAKDLEGRFILTNRWFDTFFNRPKEQIIGQTDYDLLPREAADQNRKNDQDVLAARTAIEREEYIPGEDGMHIYWSVKFPLYDTSGQTYAVCGIASDITRLKQSEDERIALQSQIIEAQNMILRELSTPLMPIANGIVVLPLIGNIDTIRAQQVLETLLEGVASHRATVAILDITGVTVVDTQVANVLIQAARAVRLLGAQVVITGINPPMAQTLVHLGVELRGIITLGSLQDGITYALRNQS